MELFELQAMELRILKELDRICKKHDITYYLAYGSLLEQYVIKDLFRGMMILIFE